LSIRTRKIIYVALGPHRIRAAEQHTGKLVATGAAVELVVPDGPAWAELAVPEGVTVKCVSHSDALGEASRMIAGRKSPLADADALIVGDLQALPAAWAAARRFPRLPIHFEPTDDHNRRPAPADLAVVTPWYPSEYNPFSGSFVKSAIGALREQAGRVSILHAQAWSYPQGSPVSPERIGLIARRIVARFGNVVLEDVPEGELTRVAVPTLTRRRDYAQWAEDHVEMLQQALPTGRIEAPLIHAHTGIYGGVMAARLARADARIVVTEHASFLPAIFGNKASREMYEEVLSRVDALLCVSSHLRDTVATTFPQYVDKLSVVPNVVDFADFPARPTPPSDLLRWLYLGALNEHKGVHTLVEAFARVAFEEPAATLTLVGNGELADRLRQRIGQLGLTDRVELHPPIGPEQVAGFMHRHDLLVHASRGETFGMTVVEAVATGTPVLVARSLGPGETLAGLDGVAGLMFDISDDPDVIVEAYRELRKRLAHLDLLAARASVLKRYGGESVGPQLLETYRSKAPEPPAAAGPESARALLIALNPPNYRRARDLANAMLAAGYAVDLLTVESEVWVRIRLDDRVRIHSLGAAERRRLVLRVEQMMVFGAPESVLAAARWLARRWHGVWPEAAVAKLQRVHRRLAAGFHKLFGRGYQFVRPRTLWRIARRDVLPQLDMARTSYVVVAGASGITIAWRLAGKNPTMTVTTSMVPPPTIARQVQERDETRQVVVSN
jgi:glycosyltransferase involved in cell wall biosynthesis